MMVTGTLEEVDNYQNLVADYPLTDSSPLVDSEFDRLPNLLGNAICEDPSDSGDLVTLSGSEDPG